MSPDHVKSPLGAKSPPTRTTAVSLLKVSRESPGEVSWVLFPTSKYSWKQHLKQDWAEGNVEQRCGFSKVSVDSLGSSGTLWSCLKSRQDAESCFSYSLHMARPWQASLPQRVVPAENSAVSCTPGSGRMSSSPCESSKLSTTVSTDRGEELQTFQSHSLKDWAWPPWELIARRPQFHNRNVLSLSRVVSVQEN